MDCGQRAAAVAASQRLRSAPVPGVLLLGLALHILRMVPARIVEKGLGLGPALEVMTNETSKPRLCHRQRAVLKRVPARLHGTRASCRPPCWRSYGHPAVRSWCAPALLHRPPSRACTHCDLADRLDYVSVLVDMKSGAFAAVWLLC